MTSNNFSPEWRVIFISGMCVNHQKSVLEIPLHLLQSEGLLAPLSIAISLLRFLNLLLIVAGLTVLALVLALKGTSYPTDLF